MIGLGVPVVELAYQRNSLHDNQMVSFCSLLYHYDADEGNGATVSKRKQHQQHKHG